MTKMWGIVVYLVIVGLDVAAAILGILAGVSQNRVKHACPGLSECSEPSQNALLGLGALVILVIAHVLDFFRGPRCISSQDEFQRSSFSKKISCTCLVLTSLTFSGGFVALVLGTMSNHKSRSSCGFTHQLLTIGGILCFLNAFFFFCVAYYVSTVKLNSNLGEQ